MTENIIVVQYPNNVTAVQEDNNVVVSNVGVSGPGIASGGTPGQVLVKSSSVNYDTSWTSSVNYAINAASATYSQNLDGYPASAYALLNSPSFTGTVNLGSNVATGSVQVALFAPSATYADTSGMTGQVHVYVKNTSGQQLYKGQAVYITGAQGANIEIGLAQANTEAKSSKTLGLLEQDLAINAFGYVASDGVVSGIDTSDANNEGDPVWLSPTTPGGKIYGLVNKPYAPNHLVYLGVVTRKNQNNGAIFVHVQNGFELKELHDVLAQSPNNNDILQYNSACSLWIAQAGSVAYATNAASATNANNSTTTSQTAFSNLSTSGSLTVGGNATFAGNLNVTGSVYFAGGTASISASNIVLNDPLLYLADGNPANISDIGIVGSFTPGASNTYQHTGLVRDASDNTWKLFSGVVPEPTTVVNFSSATWDPILLGNITASPSAGTSVIINSAVSAIGLQINPGASGSDTARFYHTNGTTYSYFDNAGRLAIRTSGTSLGNTAFGVLTASDVAIGVVIRGVFTQTADLQQWQNSSGTVQGGRNALAQVYSGSTAPVTVATGGATTAASGTGTVATITTTNAHGLAVGDLVTVAGVTPTGYNATALVTAVTTNTFSYANTTTGAQTGQGTVSVPAQASFTARSAGTVGLVVRNASSQTADLTQWQNSAGTVLSTFNASGQLVVGSATSLVSTSAAMLSIYNSSSNTPGIIIRMAGTYGTGEFPIRILDSNNNLRASIDQWGGAFFNGGVGINNQLKVGNTNLGGMLSVVNTLATGSTVAVFRAISGQTANLQEWQNSAGTVLSAFNASGQLIIGASTTLSYNSLGTTSAMLSVIQSSSNTPGIIVKRAPGGAGIQQEWQSNVGTTEAYISFGQFNAVAYTTISGAAGVGAAPIGPAGLRSLPSSTTIGLVVGGANGQTADLIRMVDVSSGSILSVFNASGQLVVGSATPLVSSSPAMLSIYQTSGSLVPGIMIQHLPNANNSNNAYSIKTLLSDGTVPFVLSANGRAGIRSGGLDYGAALSIGTGGNTTSGIIVRGNLAQTSNLQEWQNSSGSVLANINASGNMTAATYTGSGTGLTNIPASAVTNTAVTQADLLLTFFGYPTNGYETFPRLMGTTGNQITNGQITFYLFTPIKTVTVSTLSSQATTARIDYGYSSAYRGQAIYQVSGTSTLTPLAVTWDGDTSLWTNNNVSASSSATITSAVASNSNNFTIVSCTGTGSNLVTGQWVNISGGTGGFTSFTGKVVGAPTATSWVLQASGSGVVTGTMTGGTASGRAFAYSPTTVTVTSGSIISGTGTVATASITCNSMTAPFSPGQYVDIVGSANSLSGVIAESPVPTATSFNIIAPSTLTSGSIGTGTVTSPDAWGKYVRKLYAPTATGSGVVTPASVTLVAGTTYAVGTLSSQTGGTTSTPTLFGNFTGVAHELFSPIIILGLNSQTTITSASVTGSTISRASVWTRMS